MAWGYTKSVQKAPPPPPWGGVQNNLLQFVSACVVFVNSGDVNHPTLHFSCTHTVHPYLSILLEIVGFRVFFYFAPLKGQSYEIIVSSKAME